MCQPFSSCNLPPAHLAEWPGSCCGNTGVERIPKQVSAQKVYPGERKRKISRGSCRASNPTPFDHESVALPLSHSRSPSFSPSVLPRDDAMPIMTPPVALNLRPHDSVNVSLIGGLRDPISPHVHSIDIAEKRFEMRRWIWDTVIRNISSTIPRCEYHGRKK